MNVFKRKILIGMIVILFVFAFLFGLFIRLFKVQEFLISGSFYYISLIAFFMYAVKIKEKETLNSVGVDFHNIFKKIILGVGICAILSLFQLVFFLSGQGLNLQHLSLQRTLAYTVYNIYFVGFAEEFIFRGYLLDRLNELLNSRLYSVLLSSAIFALWHYPVSYFIGQVIFAFFFGIVLSTIKIKIKGNITVSLAIGHGLYNALLFWVGYFIK